MIEAGQYALDVISGKEVAGSLIKKAAQRFLNDLKRTDIVFDEDEAVKSDVFGEKYCCHYEGDFKDKPFIKSPWQKFVDQQIYGWIRKDNGKRRFTKIYIQVAKKNGKSTWCAFHGNYHGLADEKINTPKIYTAANNEDQAKICVNMAGRMIEHSPELYEYVLDGDVKLSTYGSNITEVIFKHKDGFIKALSKESDDKTSKTVGGKHGINPSMGIVDEFGMSPTYGASKTIETGMASRSERLMMYITTAGFNKDGPCFSELRDLGIKVLNGVVEMDNYLPIIFEIDPLIIDGKPVKITPEWLLKNPQVWKHSNPNLDVSVNREFLIDQLNDAVRYGGATEVENLTLNFNIWMDAPEVYIQDDVWMGNMHGLTEEDLKDVPCYGGLYTAAPEGVNNLVLYWPDVKGLHVFKVYSWLAEKFVKLNDDNIDYQAWVDEGHLTSTPGIQANQKAIATDIFEIFKAYNVMATGYDNKFGQGVVQHLNDEGYIVMEIPQVWKNLGQQTVALESLAKQKKIEHFGNPVFRLHLSKTITETNSDGMKKPDKGASGSKTGAVSAALNAMVTHFESVKEGVMTDFKFESIK